ncbi:DUF3035 domain-containing protein [Rhodobacteraceae bacterium W635]|uniref:DUF3035 domain-containing protein n=1 Tax=Nioella halotolerans TaxID=2303578 RepID=UPI000E3E4324|nr:DUF3035 domain-containing protein [Rhodobacteraceae bacterium W635]
MIRLRAAIGLGLVLLALAACGRETPTLLNLRADGEGPDEFGVLPTRPLEMPGDVADLPPPSPGGTNRADPDPEAEIATALGGNVDRAQAGSQGLVGYVTRFGVTRDIRDTLAVEDLEFRRRNDGRILERIAAINVYHRAYRVMALDRYAELERLRAAGVWTPAAPPEDAAARN